MHARGVRSKRRSFWRDDACQSIDAAKFIYVKLFRTPLRFLLSRSASNPVHLVGLQSDFCVPRCVCNLLGKSLKFVPAAKPDPIQSWWFQINKVLRSHAWFHFFSNRDFHHDRDRLHRLSIGTGAWPDQHDQLNNQGCFSPNLYRALAISTFDDVVDKWSQPSNAEFRKSQNFSRLDFIALRWLAHNADKVKAVESDKNLGFCLVATPWIKSQLSGHIANCTLLSDDEVKAHLSYLRAEICLLVSEGKEANLLSSGQERFLLHNIDSENIPMLRCNIKVHKSPVETRPIINMSDFVTGPISSFVNTALLDMQSSFKSVSTASRDIVADLDYAFCPDAILFTFDIAALYPSLIVFADDPKCVFNVLVPAILGFFSKRGLCNLADLIIKFLKVILHKPLITLFDKTYSLDRGMVTGLACATTVANIYLALSFDEYIRNSFPMLMYYKRYVDDGFCMVSASTFDQIPSHNRGKHIAALCSGWHDSIKIRPKDVSIGNSVHFLDLNISIVLGHVVFETYRKPESLFDYLPSSSCHPKSVFRGIVSTELHRLLISNTMSASFRKQVDLFRAKLCRRGHQAEMFNKICKKYAFSKRLHILHSIRSRHTRPKIAKKFIVHATYSFCNPIPRSAHFNKINNVFRHLHAIGPHQRQHHQFPPSVMLANAIGRNLFRRLYHSSWRVGFGS